MTAKRKSIRRSIEPREPSAAVQGVLADALAHERAMEALDRDQKELALRSKLERLDAKYRAAVGQLDRLAAERSYKTQTQEVRDQRRFERLAAQPHGESTGILVLTDWHCEEEVLPEKVSGLNEFNLNIAEHRIRRVFQTAVEMVDWLQRFARIKQLMVPLLGDFISGYIHPELEENNLLSPVEATRFVEPLIIEGLRFLLREKVGVQSILVPTCVGNHGRTVPKQRVASNAENSFEWLMYQHIEDRLRDEPRISFKIERGNQNLVPVQGRTVRLSHGNDFNYQGGVGGLTIPAKKWIARMNQGVHADCDMFGHWHQFHRDSYFVSSGCLIGVTPYGMRYGYEPPSQTFAVMNRKHGLIFCEPIFVEDKSDASRVSRPLVGDQSIAVKTASRRGRVASR